MSLRSDNFFCALSQESLEAFNQIKRATVFPEGAVIYVEGQIPRGIFMLCEGQVKLSTTSREGKTLTLRIAKAGEVLGLHATVTGWPYELTMETMQPCQLNFVSREDFLPFLKKHGDACLQAAQQLNRVITLSLREGREIPARISDGRAGHEWSSPRKARDDPRRDCSDHGHQPGIDNAHTVGV